MERNLHPDGTLEAPLAGGLQTGLAALLLAGFSLAICLLITEAGLRASIDGVAVAKVESSMETAERPGLRAWLAGHSLLYQTLTQRLARFPVFQEIQGRS